ncbi:MAG: hypothetical protein ACU0CC_08615 [Sagittula sp.]|jgi:hypothetical protein|uniref:hypothetical protein n=1 Tax=unclassified Sagittula TaxID=2624628 RepID=UPI000C2D10E6|nr:MULTISPECIES: hypothetical protein [unclassified Sagittula]AUC56096.1 hypothetical protein CDO87_22625 [Sagittula sp. P11]WHZ38018.1 hypothetical protein QNI11_23595 [Sagittula sp. MA-2]
MIELLFVTCMATAPGDMDTCRERSLVFTDVTPMACMMGAQPQLARWVNEHPNERIQSWKCRTVDHSERDA